MQFTVGYKCGFTPKILPSTLASTLKGTYPTLKPTTQTRTLPYFEEMGDNGPLGVFLNAQRWSAAVTETPKVVQQKTGGLSTQQRTHTQYTLT
jgi:hypothetical protein